MEDETATATPEEGQQQGPGTLASEPVVGESTNDPDRSPEPRPEKVPRLEAVQEDEAPAAPAPPAALELLAPDRPTDEQILSYENDLRAQQLEKPLLGAIEPLASLESDYAQGSQVFVSKIHSLRATYASLRRTRQDGNCFYRSFLFGYIEGVMLRRDKVEVARMIDCFKGWREKMMNVGFQELVFEDALDLVVSLLEEIHEGNLTVREVELRMCDENTSAYMIMLIRMITSCEIQRRQEHFLPFVIGMTDGLMELEDFCRRNVEAMGEESDHIQLVAVADAFRVHVRVVYLDNSGALAPDSSDSLSCHIHDFKPEEPASASMCTVAQLEVVRHGKSDFFISATTLQSFKSEEECKLNTERVWSKISKAPSVVGRGGGQLEPPSKRLGMM